MNNYSVLLVEDNSGDARLIQEYLNDPSSKLQGVWSLTIATSLSEAKDIIAHSKIDAILLDLSLPDSLGLDTLKEIWLLNPKMPIVILTGSTDEATAIDAVRNGAQDYLSKNELTSPLLIRTIQYSIERKLVEEQLRFLATHDSLTGLPNRSLFYDRLNHATLRSTRLKKGSTGKLGVAVMILDVDKFKDINDLYGHTVGDEVLKKIAKKLRDCVRNSDTVARLGGDEFTIILEGINDIKDCQLVAQKIISTIYESIIIGEINLKISMSIGISIYPTDGDEIEKLIKQADLAMYRSKKMGGGYSFFEDVK